MQPGHPAGPGRPASAEDAMALLHVALDHLTGAQWRSLGAAGQAQALRGLEAASAKLGVARSEALAAFDAAGGYSRDGAPSAQAWLRSRAAVTGAAARGVAAWERTLRSHPLLRAALAAGEVSESWARQLATWDDRLPGEEVDKADRILLDAVAAGLALHPDIARIAQAIYEAIRGQQPDPDPADDGFADRDLRLGTTTGGAGVLRGDLSARCAALLARVMAAFGQPVGRDDLRSPGQRSHDALETALGLSLGVPDVPRSGGMKTRATVVVSLADLLRLDGAPPLVQAWLAAQDEKLGDAWLTARAGEPGWQAGPGAGAAACAAHVTPVVTGAPDWDIVSTMADTFLHAHGLAAGHAQPLVQEPASAGPDGRGPASGGPGGSGFSDSAVGDAGVSGSAEPGDVEPGGRTVRAGDTGLASGGPGSGAGSSDAGSNGAGSNGAGGAPACGCPCEGRGRGPRPGSLSPAARLALERTLLRLAVRALSGPEGLAGFLRARLLGRPFSGASLPLDVGGADEIPEHLRRAVILRDRHCQWPGGCDRPASQCEPHHVRPRHQGGETSLANLTALCLVHHHHYVHRRGWAITVHPDGTSSVRAPDGRVIASHAPRDPRP